MATQQISYLKFGSTTYQLNDKNALHSLSVATTDALGGIKIGYSTDGKNYAVQLADGKAFVNVPWTDHTYTLGGLMGSTTIGGTTQPIYWDGTKFANTSFTLGKSVPSDAKFTDTTYSNATTTTAGLMSTADKGKLDGIASGANKYIHPSYTEAAAGLYKVTVDATGHVSATTAVTKGDITALGIPGSDTNTTYSASTGLTLSGTAFSLNKTTASSLGGIIASNVLSSAVTLTSSDGSTSSRYYGVQVDSTGKAFVNIPWENTTYSLAGLIGGSAKGGPTQPIYWTGSAFANTSYTLGKSVPSDAKFTDTTYGNATTAAAGLMTSAMVSKLNGIAEGANNYTHPSYTAAASGLYKVTVDASGHVSATTAVAKGDITALGIPAQDTTYGNATTAAAGLMTSAMVSKLNGIESGANAYSHPTYTAKSSGLYKITVDGTGHVSATTAVAKGDITALGIPAQDTTYGDGTLADLQSKSSTAASTVAKVWSPKVLNDWMSDIVGVDLESIVSTTTTLEKIFEDNDKTTGIISQINTKVTKGTYNITTEPTATTTVTSNPTATLTNPTVNYTKQSLTHTSASLTAALGQTDVANDTLVFTFTSGSASLTDGGVSLSGGSVSVSGGSYKTTLTGGSVSLG